MANLVSLLKAAVRGNTSVKLEKAPLNTMTIPDSFKDLREKVIDYFTGDRSRFIDPNSIVFDGDYGRFSIMSLGDALGLDHLGSGAYGSVYKISEGKAMKVIHSEDASYASFVYFLRTEGHKYSCFPKIYYSGTWGEKTVYIMELLEQTSADNHEERDLISNLARRVMSGRPFKVNRFFTVQEDFYTGMKALLDYYKKNGQKDSLSIDLHMGNVTIRQDGTAVVIDPFS